jgi:peptide/nickel transport system ATP-binding protein
MSEPLLAVENVTKRFGSVAALCGVSLGVSAGRIVGLVGGSGSGKSTLANLLLGLEAPDSGAIRFRSRPIAALDREESRHFRASVQMVFQDPFGSLNPRMTVAAAVEEPLVIQRRGDAGLRRAAALKALDDSGLRPAESFAARYPHVLSGGQRQRVAIARAIVLRPLILVADEPVSMLDVSIRNGVMRLFRSFADAQGMGIVLITHDLSLLVPWCDEVAVIRRGTIVERGPPQQIISRPVHEYTRALIAAAPRLPAI